MRLNAGKLASITQSFVVRNCYGYPVEINDLQLENYRADFKTAKILAKKYQGDPQAQYLSYLSIQFAVADETM